jgi:hypothetical protein
LLMLIEALVTHHAEEDATGATEPRYPGAQPQPNSAFQNAARGPGLEV